MTMKFTMKKFQLVSKYANYTTWDEQQNAPFFCKKLFKNEYI